MDFEIFSSFSEGLQFCRTISDLGANALLKRNDSGGWIVEYESNENVELHFELELEMQEEAAREMAEANARSLAEHNEWLYQQEIRRNYEKDLE